VKAQVTQGVLTAILERWGYRVSRLGVEELFGEIKYLDAAQYLALGLPKQLRSLPDLLVAAADLSVAHLVEVKFRKRYDEETLKELSQKITELRQYWPAAYMVVMIGEPFMTDGRYHQDYIRVIKPDRSDLLIHPEFPMETRWNCLAQLDSVFKPLVEPKGTAKMADYVTPVIKQLAKL
jgi:hypothetical protein